MTANDIATALARREIKQGVVLTDTTITNSFRRRVWRAGVRLPHQNNRECARRIRQGKATCI